MPKATIYSIANALGVSSATVSRAFSRPEKVKPSLRELILTTANELGYTPNRSARGLALGRTGLIGLVVPDVENPFFPPFIRAVQDAARQQDADVLLVDSELNTSAEADLITRLRSQTDALIIASPRLSTAQLRDCVKDGPVVVVNRVMRSVRTVVCDNTVALQTLATHLHGLGHRRFALLQGPRESWAAANRARAVRSWAAAGGVELLELGPFEAQFTDGRAAARQIVESHASAVFAFDDLMAAGVIAGMNDLGESVPRHRSIVGCDDVLLAQTMTPSLTTVSAPFEALGREAVALLDDIVSGQPARNVTLSGTAVIRGTVGPVRSTP